MAGRGPTPSTTRRRANEPERGDWQATPGAGWQHGEIPQPPARLSAAALETWQTWMTSWFAAHWTPADLPGLHLVIRLYSRVWSGKASGAERSELRQLMDNYGITPKGQQDRRWTAPKPADVPRETPVDPTTPGSRYAHLKVVNG